MNDETLPPEQDSDTSDFGELEDIDLPPAPPAAPALEGEPEPPPPAEVRVLPPRVFPQHFSLLFGVTVTTIACLTVWEREHVFGKDVSGYEMISGSLLLALSVYAVLVGMVNVLQGRMRVGSAFLAGILALWLGLKKLFASFGAPNFLSYNELKKEHETFQDAVEAWVGQFGPGVWLAILGGLVIVLVLIRALIPSKKAEPAPASASARRRRR